MIVRVVLYARHLIGDSIPVVGFLADDVPSSELVAIVENDLGEIHLIGVILFVVSGFRRVAGIVVFIVRVKRAAFLVGDYEVDVVNLIALGLINGIEGKVTLVVIFIPTIVRRHKLRKRFIFIISAVSFAVVLPADDIPAVIRRRRIGRTTDFDGLLRHYRSAVFIDKADQDFVGNLRNINGNGIISLIVAGDGDSVAESLTGVGLFDGVGVGANPSCVGSKRFDSAIRPIGHHCVPVSSINTQIVANAFNADNFNLAFTPHIVTDRNISNGHVAGVGDGDGVGQHIADFGGLFTFGELDFLFNRKLRLRPGLLGLARDVEVHGRGIFGHSPAVVVD